MGQRMILERLAKFPMVPRRKVARANASFFALGDEVNAAIVAWQLSLSLLVESEPVLLSKLML